jgi:hypothetical protein
MNTKKVLSFVMLGLLLFSFAMPLVVAADTVSDTIDKAKTAASDAVQDSPLSEPVTGPDIFTKFVNFFKLGDTWSELIVSIALIAVIFAATWDILLFTAFETKWVKYTISAGVALVVMATGVINAFTRGVIAIAGGSVAFATLIAIIMGVVFFLAGSFFKGLSESRKYKKSAMEAEGGYRLARITAVGDIRKAKAAAKAAKEE